MIVDIHIFGTQETLIAKKKIKLPIFPEMIKIISLINFLQRI